MNISRLCMEYRKQGLKKSSLWYADDWLAYLGLPPYRWEWHNFSDDAAPQRLVLAEWRQDGRTTPSPGVLCLPQDLSAGLIVLAAAALEAWGRPVPEELQALAALVLVSGTVRWEAYP